MDREGKTLNAWNASSSEVMRARFFACYGRMAAMMVGKVETNVSICNALLALGSMQ